MVILSSKCCLLREVVKPKPTTNTQNWPPKITPSKHVKRRSSTQPFLYTLPWSQISGVTKLAAEWNWDDTNWKSLHVHEHIQLFRGDGRPTLFEGHNVLTLQVPLSSGALGKWGCDDSIAGRAPGAVLHHHGWDTLWEPEAWVPFKQMISLKPWCMLQPIRQRYFFPPPTVCAKGHWLTTTAWVQDGIPHYSEWMLCHTPPFPSSAFPGGSCSRFPNTVITFHAPFLIYCRRQFFHSLCSPKKV